MEQSLEGMSTLPGVPAGALVSRSSLMLCTSTPSRQGELGHAAMVGAEGQSLLS